MPGWSNAGPTERMRRGIAPARRLLERMRERMRPGRYREATQEEREESGRHIHYSKEAVERAGRSRRTGRTRWWWWVVALAVTFPIALYAVGVAMYILFPAVVVVAAGSSIWEAHHPKTPKVEKRGIRLKIKKRTRPPSE